MTPPLEHSSNKTMGSAVIVKAHPLHTPLSSPDFFDMVLGKSSNPKPRLFKRMSNLQKILISVAMVTLVLGGYFTYVGMRTIKLSTLQAANITKVANQLVKTSTTSGNVSPNALSTANITPSMLARYEVAPSLPRYLIIPKLHVDARVLQVGLSSDGSMGTPLDIYDTAWYQGSSKPGQAGATVIDGHVASWTGPGVFNGIKNLQPGDNLQVVAGDGQSFNYQVVKVTVYPVKSINMETVLSPVVADQPGLNLITCTGSVNPDTSQYNERVVVFSKQV